jgi:hypothetical protein
LQTKEGNKIVDAVERIRVVIREAYSRRHGRASLIARITCK